MLMPFATIDDMEVLIKKKVGTHPPTHAPTTTNCTICCAQMFNISHGFHGKDSAFREWWTANKMGMILHRAYKNHRSAHAIKVVRVRTLVLLHKN